MKTALYDGASMKSITSVTESAWTTLVGKGEGSEGLKKLQKTVPWLYRGWRLRSQAVAKVPFTLFEGETEFDNSLEWENKVGFWPDPIRTLQLTEGAITLFGKNYLFKNPSMTGDPLELRYWFPNSVEAKITEKDGLVKFIRKLRDNPEGIPFEVEDIVYFWDIDPYVEIGPPLSSPATAAIAGAGVLWSVDEFAAAFFDRGAIKATVLSVPATTIQDERDRLKSWWKTIVGGIANAWSTEVINADAVKATIIGEGVQELQDTELTKEKREDIATALGIPQSKLFSSSATDSNRVADEKSFLTDTVIPECEFIAEVLNTQVFADMGLKMKFQPQTLDELQADETDRSEAFLNYVTGGLPQSVTAEMLGLDLPVSVDYEDLDEEEGEEEAAGVTDRQERLGLIEAERKQFSRWAKKRDKSQWSEFEFNHLDEWEQFQLIGHNTDVVNNADNHNEDIVKALTNVIDELRNTKEPDNLNITVNTPDVTFNAPEKEVVVNVPEHEPDTVIVKNEIPEQKIVPVNVTVEPTPVVIENKVDVTVPEPKPKKTKVRRDSTGKITEMETE